MSAAANRTVRPTDTGGIPDMATFKSWERPGAAVEGYVVPPGESLERPYFMSNRALAGTASTGGVITVEEGVLQPGQPGPYRHYHPNMAQTFYVLEGELLLQIGDQVERAGPGTFAFCPAGSVHAFRAAGTEPARVLVTAMPPGPAEGYFRELAKLPREAGEAEWDALGKKWGNIVVGPPLEAD
jgi:quercetin dioxygenase-like cupin family protein